MSRRSFCAAPARWVAEQAPDELLAALTAFLAPYRDGRTGQRTYQVIRQPGAIARRLFELEFLNAGLEAYCFAFG